MSTETKEQVRKAKAKEYHHTYYLKHKKAVKKNVRRWQKANPDKVKASARKWRETHQEYCREYYQSHKAEMMEYERKYYKDHKTELNERARERRHVESTIEGST